MMTDYFEIDKTAKSEIKFLSLTKMKMLGQFLNIIH